MFFKSARLSFAAWLERHRLPRRYAPAIFVSTFLITFGALSLLFSAWFGVSNLWSAPPVKMADKQAEKRDASGADALLFDLRASSYVEAAEMEVMLLRFSLNRFRESSDPDKRQKALRQAKEARALAIRHLEAATAISLPPDRQPDLAALRADIADLDRQIAAMPGTHGH